MCCIHRGVCALNDFKFNLFFPSQHQLAVLIELRVCSRSVMMPRALEDVLRWRNRHGAFEQNQFMSPFSSSYSLLFSTSLSLPLSASLISRWRVCCRMTGRCLAAIQGPHLPDCCSSFFLSFFLPPTAPNSTGSVVSPFQGLSQGLQMCFSEQQWWTLAEISCVSD